MKRLLAVLLGTALGVGTLLGTGCLRAARPVQLSGGDPRILGLGAFDRGEPQAPRFAWPATELRLSFRGTSVTAELSDAPVDDELRDTDWLAVQIDDGPIRKLALREGRHRYTLARELPNAVHRLRIAKRTEAEVGTITLHGFTLSPGASVEPSPRPRRRILFVGDSITAGYGNEGANELCHYSPHTSDATRTFATVAARELDAEAVISAWSGKGVLRNFDGREPLTMPALFDRVIPSEPYPRQLPMLPAPDALVVALGTNDFFAGTPDETAFLAAYRRLLQRLAGRAPRAPLVLVLSPMLADDSPQPNARTNLRRWLTALKDERERLGARVVLVEQWTDPAEGVGCDFHPSLRTHERLGHELATALRALAGW